MAGVHYKNFEDHHSQRSFTVFYFYGKEQADYFESLLIEHGVTYERGDSKDLLRRHLFGIHKSQQEIAERLNDETCNFFRKPFIANNALRYFILFITLAAIVLAILGSVFG